MSETLHLEGDLYIETFTNNVSNGVIGPVDVNSLEVKPDSEKISRRQRAAGGESQADSGWAQRDRRLVHYPDGAPRQSGPQEGVLQGGGAGRRGAGERGTFV